MSLKQIHVLDKIVSKKHKQLKRELKILEIKKNIYNRMKEIVDTVVDTYYDILNRFTYEDKSLAYTKRR